MINLIPAIDIIDGKCVRLTKGDYNRKTVYNDNPVEVARAFETHGFKRLHVVDLDGAKSRHIVNTEILKKITSSTNLVVDFGGGVKSEEDVQLAFNCGASLVTVGSLAVKDPSLFISWMELYGSDKFILGADVDNNNISINGWKERSVQKLDNFLQFYIEKGIRHVLCTDISRDGTLEGPSIGLYRRILSTYPDIDLIASGGVGSMADLKTLEEAGIPSVVIGKAFYEGRITWKEVEEFINK